ncbi:hypothetical protein OG216_17215 [Streptomycetaceae bacterium NBC_01309]
MTVLAPAAQAGVVNPTVHCVLPAGQGEATGPQSMDVTLTPANAAPGSLVHAVVTLGTGPANSTVSLNDVPTTPSIELAMSGGATGTVTVTGPTVNLDTVSGQPVLIPTYEGDFVVPNTASGVVSFAPLRTVTKTVVFGGTYTTPCDVVSGGGSIGTVNVQGPGSQQPTLTSPTGMVRPGYTLNFSGAGFPASATATLSVCPAAGGACVLNPFSSSGVNISAAGVLTGTAVLTTAIPDGAYLVKVAAVDKEASSPITVQAFVQSGPRVASMTPTSGPVGTVVNITGSNWKANTALFAVGADATGTAGPGTAVLRTDPDGNLSASYTINNANVTQIRIREGVPSSSPTVFLPYTVTVAAPTLAASPQVSNRNGMVTLTGSNWPAGATPTAALCDTAGNNCNAASLTNSTLAISPAGALSGTVKVAGSVTPANYTVKVTASGLSATTPLTVQKHSISLSPSSGPLGTKTWITGDDFADWAWIKLYGVNAAGQKTGDYNYAAADGAGNWITWMYLNDPTTVRIVAEETFNSSVKASAPFTYTP